MIRPSYTWVLSPIIYPTSCFSTITSTLFWLYDDHYTRVETFCGVFEQIHITPGKNVLSFSVDQLKTCEIVCIFGNVKKLIFPITYQIQCQAGFQENEKADKKCCVTLSLPGNAIPSIPWLATNFPSYDTHPFPIYDFHFPIGFSSFNHIFLVKNSVASFVAPAWDGKALHLLT